MSDTNTTDPSIKVTMLQVDQLHANDWNPNTMAHGRYKQLRHEIRRTGQPPTPIAVRPADGGKYTIIDGEHRWKASIDEGLTEVPCQIYDLDDFHCMLETYKRNQHGRHNKVLEGRLFGRMMRERKKTDKKYSIRKFAKDNKISEGTVRNALMYADVAKLRNAYAGENHDEQIGKLSIQRVRMYNKLPVAIRDKWMDAGAWIGDVQNPIIDAEDGGWRFLRVVDSGLAYMFDIDGAKFRDVAKLSVDYCDWRSKHGSFPNQSDYIRAAATRLLPVAVMNLLPIRVSDGQAEACLTVEQWDEILGRCTNMKRTADLLQSISANVRVTLRDAGIDPLTVYDPEDVEMIQDVAAAPDFIRDADHLTIREQHALAKLTTIAPDDVLTEAKQLVIQHLRWRRESPDDPLPEHLLGGLNGSTVDDCFVPYLRHVLHQRRLEADHQVLADRDLATQAIATELGEAAPIKDGTIDERPAAKVLAERVAALPDPELFLLVGIAVFNDTSRAAATWLSSLGGAITEMPDEGVENSVNATRGKRKTTTRSRKSRRNRSVERRSLFPPTFREHPVDPFSGM